MRMEDGASVAGLLLAWYDVHRRSLPWRENRDPYRIWVSEVMLQQTRVETVLSYFNSFLERFPDIRTLADAELEGMAGSRILSAGANALDGQPTDDR